MRSETIARNYAEALFALGERSGQSALYADLIDAVAAAIQNAPEIQTVLMSPRVPKQEKSRLLAEHKRLMSEAKAQAHAIVLEARQLAEKERAVAMEKTKQEQEELLQRARREIAIERDRAVADLRREAVDLSLAAASKLIGERLSSETDRKIVSEYLVSLEGTR